MENNLEFLLLCTNYFHEQPYLDKKTSGWK